MNISHNYSGLGEERATQVVSELDHQNDSTPKCLDEESLQKLINIPSSIFFSKPNLTE